MTFKTGTIRFKAAQAVFPKFDLVDDKDSEGNYKATNFFGRVLVHVNLTDLCVKIVEELIGMITRAQERSDRAYEERNLAVILGAKLAIQAGHKAGWGVDPGHPDWASDWKTLVYIETDKGQASWHMSPDLALKAQAELPQFEGDWDGKFLSRESALTELI